MTKDGGKGMDEDPTKSMQLVLGSQPETLVTGLGGQSLMLPKYNCERNPIELVWGLSKLSETGATTPLRAL